VAVVSAIVMRREPLGELALDLWFVIGLGCAEVRLAEVMVLGAEAVFVAGSGCAAEVVLAVEMVPVVVVLVAEPAVEVYRCEVMAGGTDRTRRSGSQLAIGLRQASDFSGFLPAALS
jgi:hypothetical protein